jgi:PrcB C-terminal
VRWLGRLALALAAVFSGCASTRARAPSNVTASVLRASTQCGGEVGGPSARWITNEGELRAAMGAGGSFGEPAAPVDFRREGVLAVYMGQRPTAGYSLDLHDPNVPVENGLGTVTVRFEQPGPGSFVAQVLTSPCLLVRLPKAGLRQIRVVDPTGTVRASVNVVPVPPEPRERARPVR